MTKKNISRPARPARRVTFRGATATAASLVQEQEAPRTLVIEHSAAQPLVNEQER
jgi:hypothetical protein